MQVKDIFIHVKYAGGYINERKVRDTVSKRIKGIRQG